MWDKRGRKNKRADAISKINGLFVFSTSLIYTESGSKPAGFVFYYVCICDWNINSVYLLSFFWGVSSQEMHLI